MTNKMCECNQGRMPCTCKPVVPPAVAEYAVKERQAHTQNMERLAGIIAEVVKAIGIEIADDANLGPGPDICSLGDEAVRKLKARPALEEFTPRQWWYEELDVVAKTLDQRRAMAVVRNLMQQYELARAMLADQLAALKLCVASLDQLLPYLGKVPADVGLINEALMAARPLIADKEGSPSE